MALPNDKYITDDYLDKNPSWDVEDSPWKAKHVSRMLENNRLNFQTICEVGCGAGGVLVSLKDSYPKASFLGYDIAPSVIGFWHKHQTSNIKFVLGDFFELDSNHYDVVLLLDVLEHVADPHEFLLKLKTSSDYVVVHFPLDLSALSVLRESPLLHVRRKVGHIHSFTKGLALELLDECGYEVLDVQYTNAAMSAPQRTLKTRLFGYVRRLMYACHKDMAVRLLGGETLMVLAKPKVDSKDA